MKEAISKNIKKVLMSPYILLSIVLFVILIIDKATGSFLSVNFGVHPRTFDNWYSIFTSTLFHGNLSHLFSNLQAFIVIGFLLCRSMTNKEFYFMWVMLSVMSGVCVWLFGAPGSYHIGASSVVFGMWSFALTLAVCRKSLKDVAIALFLMVFYGFTFFYGIIPKEGVSFAGHFYGIGSGVVFGMGFVPYKTTAEKEKIDR